jgi:tetratricopeptide (TPR) repeat protein
MSTPQVKSSLILLAALSTVLALASSMFAQTDASPAAQSSKTWAVVIGISKYPKVPGGQQLQFAESDATAFAEAIKKGGVKPENMRLLTGTAATVGAIKSALGTWIAKAANESDTVLIFFSGHGVYEHEFGESYLLGYDSDPKDLFGSALSISDLTQALARRVNSRRVLIMTDAVRRDFFDPDAGGASKATAFVQAFNQLATLRAGFSAIMASGPGEFSREGQRWGGHGVFSKHLIDALSGSADRNGDGMVAADELFDLVAARVVEDTSNKQHPWHSESPLAQMILAQVGRQPSAQIATVKIEPSNNAAAPELPASPKPYARPEATSAVTAQKNKIEPAQVIAKDSAPPVADVRPDPNGGKATAARHGAAAPPEVRKVDAARPAATTPFEPVNKELAVASVPAPPRPAVAPPNPVPVVEGRNAGQPVVTATPISVSKPDAVPSPLILQLEAAIASKNLVEPKSASAWDIYQRLSSEQSAQADLARLKPMLADALASYGRSIVGGDVRADNVSEKVDDFKRAGQMFARARTLMPEDREVVMYEKLSAAQALIALQFYDEAERALAQVQGAKLACVENAMGIVYQGKLDTYRAERAFKRAAELDAKWATPHYNLALLYRSQQSDESIKELEQAAALDPASMVFLVTLGDEYFTRQQWQRAADAFRKAIALKPADDSLHTKLGHALYSQGLQEEANREYQKARALRGKP